MSDTGNTGQPAPDSAPADDGDGSVSVELIKPIRVFNDTLKTLKFRKPTGKDFFEVGSHVVFDPTVDPPKISHDWSKLRPIMARLTDNKIPSSSFDMMDPNDVASCAWALTPFFLPMGAKRSSTAPLN
jgi:hypothetical protein